MSGPGASVTVVIPVWDGYVHFLSDAVDSVRQSAPDAPIVVVDNASTTPVPELEGCQVVRSSTRLSEGAARNLGLEQVLTQYVVFLDADDMLLAGTLELLQEQLDADAGLVVSASSILDGETGERHRTPRRFALRLAQRPRAFALANSVWSLLPIQGCAILRTAQMREAGGYADADLGEDWDLAVSLAWRGRVEVSGRFGLLYRTPRGSIQRRARTARELRASAGRVRERIRRDVAVPPWARFLLPVVAVLQLAAIHLARPLYLAGRRFVSARRSNIA
jgi:glycosyltransferase involved in cell wall biosynthesis